MVLRDVCYAVFVIILRICLFIVLRWHLLVQIFMVVLVNGLSGSWVREMQLKLRLDIHYFLYTLVAVFQKVLHLCTVVQFHIDVFNIFFMLILIILHFDAHVMCWGWARVCSVS